MATELTSQNMDYVGRDVVLMSFRQAYASGTGAINHTYTPDIPVAIRQITLHLNAAPTTSENFIITVDSGRGAAYDTVVYSVNLSTASTTDVILTEQLSDLPILIKNDVLLITFTNTDGNTWGLTVIAEAL